MKTGDLVIYSGLVNPDLNIGMVEEEATHKMLVWDENKEVTFWWEPIPAIIEGHVYRFGFTLKNLRNNKIECEEEAERHLNIEQLHCATVAIIRDVWGES